MTRDEAKAAGLKRYHTGKPCLRGHDSERQVCNKACCQCLLERSQTPDVKAYAAERKKTPKAKAQRAAYNQANAKRIAAQKAGYRQANRAEIAAQKAAYDKANTEKRAAQNAAYRAANAENIAAKRAAYRKANPHLVNAIRAKRRAAKLQATPRWADLEAIREIYELAAFITQVTGESNHVDHIYPLQGKTACGLHVHQNLQILTASDNIKKSNKVLHTV